MHMSDAMTAPAVAAVMFAASGVTAAYSVKKLKENEDLSKIPTMGVMGAFVFAAQMVNFTIPGTGSSGHLCGGMMVSAILGPYAGFITMIGILLIQCLMFADGGLMALGANIWNMAFYGCFAGALLIWKPIIGQHINKKRITVASILGCIISLQLGSFSVVLETLLSGITSLPFTTFLFFMQPIHLAIGLVEGLITAAVLCFIYEKRPSLLWCSSLSDEQKDKSSFKEILTILAVTALVIGGGISLLASSHPDGLEWSVEKVTGDSELESSGKLFDVFASVQEKTSLLPDYSFDGAGDIIGTIMSGIVGCVTVAACFILISRLMRRSKLKKQEN